MALSVSLNEPSDLEGRAVIRFHEQSEATHAEGFGVRFVEEIVVEELLPTVRSMLAESLRDRGYTQRETADALGISQSAVSKYAHGDVGRNDRVLADDRVQETVERVADGLAAGDLTRVAALTELEVLIRELERGGLLATLHEEAMPALAETSGTVTIHDPEGELRTRERTLAALRRGLRELRHTAGFGRLIPNVGSNLVTATPDADSIADVAGVPGRIFQVKGETTVPADPEFGVSEHVAGVLLAARAGGQDPTAALNVQYDEALLDTLAAAGHESVVFDAENGPAAVERAVAGRSLPETFVVYQTGGVGIEPITYLLGNDPVEVVEIARELT